MEKFFLKPSNKYTNFEVPVKGKTSVLRPPLTGTSKFVEGRQGLKEKYEIAFQSKGWT